MNGDFERRMLLTNFFFSTHTCLRRNISPFTLHQVMSNLLQQYLAFLAASLNNNSDGGDEDDDRNHDDGEEDDGDDDDMFLPPTTLPVAPPPAIKTPLESPLLVRAVFRFFFSILHQGLL